MISNQARPPESCLVLLITKRQARVHMYVRVLEYIVSAPDPRAWHSRVVYMQLVSENTYANSCASKFS